MTFPPLEEQPPLGSGVTRAPYVSPFSGFTQHHLGVSASACCMLSRDMMAPANRGLKMDFAANWVSGEGLVGSQACLPRGLR